MQFTQIANAPTIISAAHVADFHRPLSSIMFGWTGGGALGNLGGTIVARTVATPY